MEGMKNSRGGRGAGSGDPSYRISLHKKKQGEKRRDHRQILNVLLMETEARKFALGAQPKGSADLLLTLGAGRVRFPREGWLYPGVPGKASNEAPTDERKPTKKAMSGVKRPAFLDACLDAHNWVALARLTTTSVRGRREKKGKGGWGGLESTNILTPGRDGERLQPGSINNKGKI